MGGGSHTTSYEAERVGVDKRRYGEVSKTGFQSQEQYDNAMKLVDTGYNPPKVNSLGTEAYSKDALDAYNKSLTDANLKYDTSSNRWQLASGVDLEAAKEDWGNYTLERGEIAAYNANEDRRKAAPDSLTGTSGKVDYSLGISTDDKEKDDKTASTTTYDESASTASTSQSLGIY